MTTLLGSWWHPENPEVHASGELVWEPPSRPRLVLLNPSIEMWAGPLDMGRSVAIERIRVPMLHGLAIDRGPVTLVGVRFGGFRYGRTASHRAVVDFAVLGCWLDTPDEAAFRRGVLEHPGIGLLLAQPPLKTSAVPNDRSRRFELHVSGTRRSWKHNGITVELKFDRTYSVEFDRAEIAAVSVAVITSSQRQSLDWWVERWLQPLHDFLSIATGQPVSPARVLLWPKVRPRGRELDELGSEIWASGIEPESEGKADTADTPMITVDDVDRQSFGLHGVLAQYRRVAREHEIFVSLVRSAAYRQDQPLPNRYLDVMSALEAYHTQVSGEGPIAESDFKSRRREAIAAVKEALGTAAAVKFIRDWLPKRAFYSLEQRISDLGSQSGLLDSWSIPPGRL